MITNFVVTASEEMSSREEVIGDLICYLLSFRQQFAQKQVIKSVAKRMDKMTRAHSKQVPKYLVWEKHMYASSDSINL